MADAIRIRPFEDGDLDEVLEMLRLSLGEPPGLRRTKELFAWKHLENPFGRSLMLVAEEESRLAGFRAFMRWDLVGPDGYRLHCVRAVDTATHPDFQRRGVFRQLTLAGIELATAADLDLIFNTPNQKSGPGYLTMGWRELGAIGVMVRPGWGALTRRGATSSWASDGPSPTKAALAEASTLLGRPPLGWRTPRSVEYLHWRFGSHPTAHYGLSQVEEGVAIGRTNMRKGRRELVVSELGGSSRAVGVMRGAVRPDYTVGWFSAQAPERGLALRGGLFPVPGLKALRLMIRPLRSLDHDLGWSKWDLSLGDVELL